MTKTVCKVLNGLHSHYHLNIRQYSQIGDKKHSLDNVFKNTPRLHYCSLSGMDTLALESLMSQGF